MGIGKKSGNSDLIQILLNIIFIGVFSIIKELVLYFSSNTWLLFMIFGILTLLMYCILAINLYYIIMGRKKKDNPQEGMQAQALLYKQIKKMEEELNKQIEELKINQLRSVKVIMAKVEGNSQEEDLSDNLKGFDAKFEKIEQTQEELKTLLEGVAADQMKVSTAAQTNLSELVEETATEELNASEEVKTEESLPAEDAVEEASVMEEAKKTTPEIPMPVDDNPNRELTPEEIAALFAGVN